MRRALTLLTLAAGLGTLATGLLMGRSDLGIRALASPTDKAPSELSLGDGSLTRMPRSSDPSHLLPLNSSDALREADSARVFSASGRVVSRENGRPLARVQVSYQTVASLVDRGTFELPPSSAPSQALTSQRGIFELDDLPGSAVIGTLQAPGWSPLIAHLPMDQGTTLSSTQIELRPSASILGNINGGPATKELRVHARAHDLVLGSARVFVPDCELTWVKPIDASGNVHLDDLPSEVPLTVQVWRPGDHGPLSQLRIPLVLEPGQQRSFQFNLIHGSQLSGVVVEANGEPAANIPVWLLAAESPAASRSGDARAALALSREEAPLRTAFTDPQGRFVFANLAPDSYGVGVPADPAPDQALGSLSHSAPRRAVEVREGAASTQVRLVLHRDRFLSGSLLDQDGEPGSGVVLARGLDCDYAVRATVGPQFRLGPLPPGSYELKALPIEQEGVLASEPLRVEAGTADCVLRLRRRVPLLCQALGPSSQPVPASFLLTDASGRPVQEQRSRDGQPVEFQDLGAGRYGLMASTDDGRYGYLGPVVLPRTPSREVVPIRLVQGATLRVRYTGRAPEVQARLLRNGKVVAETRIERGDLGELVSPPGNFILRLRSLDSAPAGGSEALAFDQSQGLSLAAEDHVLLHFGPQD